MSREQTLTTIRAMRDEEEHLLAEHGLRAERVIGILRLLLQVMRGVAYPLTLALLGKELDVPVPLRIAAITVYVIACVVHVVVLTWVVKTPSPRASRIAPLSMLTLDFVFLAVMAYTASPIEVAQQPTLIGIFCLVLISFGALRLRRSHVLYSAVLGQALFLGTCALTVQRGFPFEPIPTVFTVVSMLVVTVLVLYLSRRIREMFDTLRTRENLRRFLPKQVADRIEKQNMRALDPVKREVTVLFSDIRDFTAMSEAMDPQAVLKLLDDYFGRMSAVVQARGGTVGKFIGDGMLCFWGVPEDDHEHAPHAVQAALDMRKVMEELNRERAHRGEEPLRIGVGIHTGPVAAGELGGKGEGLHEYTVIGDSVNLASRIEGLTKQHQVDILVSGHTWAKLGARFNGTLLGEEKVKGRHELVRVHAVTERTVAAGSALV
jgi:adenylate cyclase